MAGRGGQARVAASGSRPASAPPPSRLGPFSPPPRPGSASSDRRWPCVPVRLPIPTGPGAPLPSQPPGPPGVQPLGEETPGRPQDCVCKLRVTPGQRRRRRWGAASLSEQSPGGTTRRCRWVDTAAAGGLGAGDTPEPGHLLRLCPQSPVCSSSEALRDGRGQQRPALWLPGHPEGTGLTSPCSLAPRCPSQGCWLRGPPGAGPQHCPRAWGCQAAASLLRPWLLISLLGPGSLCLPWGPGSSCLPRGPGSSCLSRGPGSSCLPWALALSLPAELCLAQQPRVTLRLYPPSWGMKLSKTKKRGETLVRCWEQKSTPNGSAKVLSTLRRQGPQMRLPSGSSQADPRLCPGAPPHVWSQAEGGWREVVQEVALSPGHWALGPGP